MGFVPIVPASERLQTNALDHAATGIGYLFSDTITILEYLRAECDITAK